MQKTKIGITVGLMGAALFFLGATSFLCAFILAGYILLVEENEWLKKCAIKMMVIVVAFSLLTIGVGMIKDVFSILNLTLGSALNMNIRVPLNLDSIVIYILNLCENIILGVMGLRALTIGTMKLNFVDKIITKHM